jgi:hypothetical protein
MIDDKDNSGTSSTPTPDKPSVPQFPTGRVELNDIPEIPSFPVDRIEKGEKPGYISNSDD